MKTMPDLTTPIADELNRVIEVFDRELGSDLAFVNDLVDQVRRYRGKLLRPRLLLLSGAATGRIGQGHIVLAAVVEMVHMATLVHDDVLDEADVRRRSPTVNRLVGNEGAVLLGDFLISHAYHLCSSLDSTHASQRVAAVTNTVCEGELMQIHHRGNEELSEADYLEIIRRKTAALTSVCCELGAWASHAAAEQVRQMADFGMDVGMAFQIVDDLLDLTGTENELGKTVGRDADLGKWTLPVIRFRDTADTEEKSRLLAVMRGSSDDRTAGLRRLLAGSDAVSYALEAAQGYVRSALARLADLPPSEARGGLIGAAEFIVTRTH